MIQVLLKVLTTTGLALFQSLATQAMFEWLFLKLAAAAAKSTKTEFDDELVEKIKESLGKKEV